MKRLIDILWWIVPVVLGASLLWGLYDGRIEPSHLIFFTSWSFGVIAPMTLVLRKTLAVILKEKIPYGNIMCLVILTMMANGMLMIGLLVLSKSELGYFKEMPALGWWIASFVSCALGYLFNLGTSQLPTSKELRVQLRVRTALIISIFMSALQQLLYYIIMELLSFV